MPAYRYQVRVNTGELWEQVYDGYSQLATEAAEAFYGLFTETHRLTFTISYS